MSCSSISVSLGIIADAVGYQWTKGEMSADTARSILIHCRKAVHCCDGMESIALGTYWQSMCGCCMKFIPRGKPLYFLIRSSASFDHEFPDKHNPPLVNWSLCDRCIDEVVNGYFHDENAADRVKKEIMDEAEYLYDEYMYDKNTKSHGIGYYLSEGTPEIILTARQMRRLHAKKEVKCNG